MSVRFTLTDDSFPVSGAFLDFVHRKLDGLPFEDVDWLDQVTERFTADRSKVDRFAKSNAAAVLSLTPGRKVIEELYQVLTWVLTGDSIALRSYFKGYRFVWIVGAPRTGGTFMLNRLLQHYECGDVDKLPAFVVHDGTPDVAFPGPVRSVQVLSRSAMQIAELAVGIKLLYPRPCIVVKKALKYAFAGPLFDSVFGDPLKVVVTVREPLPVAWSVMSKSGLKFGKATRRFSVHCPIDQLMHDLCVSYYGMTYAQICDYDYQSVVCLFWAAFYQVLASSLAMYNDVDIVPFGEPMADYVQRNLKRRSDVCSDFVLPVLPVLPFTENDWVLSRQVVKSVTSAFTRIRKPFPGLSTV